MPAYGRIPNPETPRAAMAYPVTAHPSYGLTTARRRWWWENGAWLDQGQTGTCVANAIEHRLADAPIAESGVTEADARTLYVAATGDASMQQGTSALTVCRYLKSQGKIGAYHWVTSPDEMTNTLLALGSITIGINWYFSMEETVIRHGRQYLNLDRSSGVAGGHEVLVNGIRLDTVAPELPFARVKNSWGRGWGNSGTAAIELTDLWELVFNEGGDACLISELAA